MPRKPKMLRKSRTETRTVSHTNLTVIRGKSHKIRVEVRLIFKEILQSMENVVLNKIQLRTTTMSWILTTIHSSVLNSAQLNSGRASFFPESQHSQFNQTSLNSGPCEFLRGTRSKLAHVSKEKLGVFLRLVDFNSGRCEFLRKSTLL